MFSSADGARGQIVTFYSYKGGTGRTMLLANVAWIIASNGYKVLLIDWDLEAPGLHLYLRPFLIDTELHNTPGIIDFVWDAAKKIVTPYEPGQSDDGQITESLSLENYVVGLDYEFPSGGLIDFIPAGRQSTLYAQRVNTFDWENFYARLGGGKILQAARESLRDEYDLVLIDSRTGVSDTSSICTVQLPDKVAICFTLNRQSIEGAGAIAASIREQKGRQFKIFPVPTRLENAETDKRDKALNFARATFRECVTNLQEAGGLVSRDEEAKYWADVQIPYRTFYAFEEVPAVFKDVPLERGTILESSENIASRLIGRNIRLVVHDPVKRAAIADAFAFDPQPPRGPTIATSSGRTIYLAKPASDMREAYERVAFELQGKGFKVLPDTDIPSDQTATEVVRNALARAEASVHLLGEKWGFTPEGLDPIVKLQLALARERPGKIEQTPGAMFRRLIWAPTALDGEPSSRGRARDPLEALASADQQIAADNIDGGNLASFVGFLFQYLAETAPRPATPQSASEKLKVYVAFHSVDEDYAGAIVEALRGSPVKINIPASGSDAETRRFNNDILTKCDAVIVVWANASEVWLRSEADRLSDWKALGRKEQFGRRILIIGPPPSQHKRPQFVQLLFEEGQFDSVVDLVERGPPTREMLASPFLDWFDPTPQSPSSLDATTPLRDDSSGFRG
jgi:MinD-like ATPase involved in chromosome partitioning or flagellar assembly